MFPFPPESSDNFSLSASFAVHFKISHSNHLYKDQNIMYPPQSPLDCPIVIKCVCVCRCAHICVPFPSPELSEVSTVHKGQDGSHNHAVKAMPFLTYIIAHVKGSVA